MALIRDDDLVRVELTDGEHAMIKRQFSGIDRERINGATASGTRVQGDNISIDFEVGYTASKLRALEIAIRSWSFQEDGGPVPVTSANIARLSEEDVDRIVKRVNELNPVRRAEEKKDSPSSSTEVSSTEATGPMPLPISASWSEPAAG